MEKTKQTFFISVHDLDISFTQAVLGAMLTLWKENQLIRHLCSLIFIFCLLAVPVFIIVSLLHVVLSAAVLNSSITFEYLVLEAIKVKPYFIFYGKHLLKRCGVKPSLCVAARCVIRDRSALFASTRWSSLFEITAH